MPYQIDRIKFLDTYEWADLYGIHYNTVMRWIQDGLPALKIGMGKRKHIYLIPKTKAMKYAKKEWGVIPPK
jgi:predicted site-specific integrase-resolvase|tara:strand:+ start:170 stop:382 length:213 start_codon:yes stop_codon:yes gene_type:complete